MYEKWKEGIIARYGPEIECFSVIPLFISLFSVWKMSLEEDYTPKNILITGGAGFMYLGRFLLWTCRASHVVILLAKKYPQYKIVNMDCLDYCATLNNLKEIEDLPNYKFVEVFYCFPCK